MSTDAPEELFSDEDGVLYAEQVVPQPGILGFTLRELLITGAWLVLFIVSFFPVGWGPALWLQGISWIIPLGLPTVAVFLIVLRRLSPEGIRRVGSLGIDQFASVVFSIAALWWGQVIWQFASVSAFNGSYGVIWVPWVQLVALLMLVVVTVAAPLIPGLREDFHGRLVTLAHRNANPVRTVVVRPRPERQLVDESVQDDAPESDEEQIHEESVPLTEHASGGVIGTAMDLDDDYVPAYRRSSETGTDQPQPFWALAPTERDVVDDRGEPLFRIGPDAWALVIEDRGGAYVVRHDDGRTGYLHDIADITKG